MTRVLPDDRVRLLRLHAQRLHIQGAGEKETVSLTVRGVCGLQAQNPGAAALGVRVRTRGLVASEVDEARVHERSVVRTWAMRGTLHLLAAADLGWLLPLLGPVFMRATRRRRAALGLDDQTTERGVEALRAVLAEYGPSTRSEIVERLDVCGIHLEGQAAPHLIGYAALAGVVCCGPDVGRHPTYVLLDDWVPRDPPRSEPAALEALGRRYLAAFGPAGPDDFAAWSGLPFGRVRAAWAGVAANAVEVEVAGRPAWLCTTHVEWMDELPAEPSIRLLPSFDTYLLGYRDRRLCVAPEHAKRVNAGGGVLHPTVVRDGKAIGTWKTRRHRDHLEVLVEPFDGRAQAVTAELAAEVADLARFLQIPAVGPILDGVA